MIAKVTKTSVPRGPLLLYMRFPLSGNRSATDIQCHRERIAACSEVARQVTIDIENLGDDRAAAVDELVGNRPRGGLIGRRTENSVRKTRGGHGHTDYSVLKCTWDARYPYRQRP